MSYNIQGRIIRGKVDPKALSRSRIEPLGCLQMGRKHTRRQLRQVINCDIARDTNSSITIVRQACVRHPTGSNETCRMRPNIPSSGAVLQEIFIKLKGRIPMYFSIIASLSFVQVASLEIICAQYNSFESSFLDIERPLAATKLAHADHLLQKGVEVNAM